VSEVIQGRELQVTGLEVFELEVLT
jgi:hypothetical protein